MFRCLLWVIAAAVRPKVLLIADNLCLRQQLLVLQRREPRPGLKDTDRRFGVLACRWFVDWRTSLLIVKPETVLRWHRHGWRTYWRTEGEHSLLFVPKCDYYGNAPSSMKANTGSRRRLRLTVLAPALARPRGRRGRPAA